MALWWVCSCAESLRGRAVARIVLEYGACGGPDECFDLYISILFIHRISSRLLMMGRSCLDLKYQRTNVYFPFLLIPVHSAVIVLHITSTMASSHANVTTPFSSTTASCRDVKVSKVEPKLIFADVQWCVSLDVCQFMSTYSLSEICARTRCFIWLCCPEPSRIRQFLL
jgi:hypothetical protein